MRALLAYAHAIGKLTDKEHRRRTRALGNTASQHAPDHYAEGLPAPRFVHAPADTAPDPADRLYVGVLVGAEDRGARDGGWWLSDVITNARTAGELRAVLASFFDGDAAPDAFPELAAALARRAQWQQAWLDRSAGRLSKSEYRSICDRLTYAADPSPPTRETPEATAPPRAAEAAPSALPGAGPTVGVGGPSDAPGAGRAVVVVPSEADAGSRPMPLDALEAAVSEPSPSPLDALRAAVSRPPPPRPWATASSAAPRSAVPGSPPPLPPSRRATPASANAADPGSTPLARTTEPGARGSGAPNPPPMSPDAAEAAGSGAAAAPGRGTQSAGPLSASLEALRAAASRPSPPPRPTFPSPEPRWPTPEATAAPHRSPSQQDAEQPAPARQETAAAGRSASSWWAPEGIGGAGGKPQAAETGEAARPPAGPRWFTPEGRPAASEAPRTLAEGRQAARPLAARRWPVPPRSGQAGVRDGAHLRISNADRQRAGEALMAALTDGRLSPVEYGKRLQAVHAAKTYGELLPRVENLDGLASDAEREPVIRAVEAAGRAGALEPAETLDLLHAARTATTDAELSRLTVVLRSLLHGAEGSPANPRLSRVTDADRERVVGRLQTAIAEGRLTLDEYDDRVQQTYAARRFEDFEPIVGDLPAP
ncbi:hypothetical protein Pa4123_44290 [Phytohabitans aurantiacus]|uniref:DUF1707 domain-containing protein n=1 Tax=Phytohabitans aurantiacus TaxID=3016789 RepID=A0ABQ5QY84_9ACTN|nr:hypothetical protein Pa4123_44290 [Phytohabitans aurantiacus]